MISPLDTRIAFFGGAAQPAVVEAIVKLKTAGFDVVVASHDPREAPALRDAGVTFIDDRMEALLGSQVVITSLHTSADVENLYLGDEGLLELMDPGTFCIDLSVSSPRLAREIQAVAAVSDIEVLDAPIVCVGEGEQAVVFVGGDPQTQSTLSPLFPFFAPIVMPQEAAGDGQFAAMISIIALAGSLMGTVEAMSLAHIAGFPEKNALNVLASTSGGSRALIDYIPRVLGHDYTGRINIATFLDMLDVALDAAEEFEVTIPMTETAYQLYELLQAVGGEEMSIQALALLYEDEQTTTAWTGRLPTGSTTDASASTTSLARAISMTTMVRNLPVARRADRLPSMASSRRTSEGNAPWSFSRRAAPGSR